MTDQKPTVFISYRREHTKVHARLLCQELRHRGYDVFLDVDSLGAGHWGEIIPAEIARRQHFLILLAPGTLDRIHELNDWVRREIEQALETERNIVPIFIEGFTFDDRIQARYLPGELENLPAYQGAKLDIEEFYEASIDRLCRKYLTPEKASPSAAPPPTPEQAQVIASIGASIEKEIRETDKEAEIAFLQGHKAYEEGDYKTAVQHYTKAIHLNPDYATAYYNRGLAYVHLGEHRRAIEDYNKAIQLNPDYATAYYNRGLAYADLGEHRRAIEDYNKAIQLNPDYATAYNNRGNAYADLGEHRRAIEDYNKAIHLNPDFATAYYNRGNAYADLGEYETALADFERSVELNPDANGFAGVGEAHFALGDSQKALEAFHKAHQHDQKNAYIMANLAVAYFAQGNIKEAKRYWRQGKAIKADERFNDLAWVGKEWIWPPQMIEAARQLIATLDD